MNTTFITDLITALWLGFTGACIGSFLNVVAYRMPLGMSVVWKPSHCPKCSHAIRAYDNVPVLGWLWLRGRCRDCGEPISPRYAIVEFVMGLAFFVLAYVELFSGGANLPGGPITEFVGAVQNVWYPQWELIGVYAYHCTLLSLLMCIALIDLDSKKVPRLLIGFGFFLGIAMACLGVRTWIGMDQNPFKGFDLITSLVWTAWGAACGYVAGAIVSALWRGKLATVDEVLAKEAFLFERNEKPYSKTENLLMAFALAGLFLGYQMVFYSLVFTIAIRWVLRELLPKPRWGNAKLVLPIFFGVVTVLIIVWKQLEYFVDSLDVI